MKEKIENPTIQQGWTLRDEFANSVLQGIITNEHLRDAYDRSTSDGKEMSDKIANVSYSIADAMLKARKNQ